MRWQWLLKWLRARADAKPLTFSLTRLPDVYVRSSASLAAAIARPDSQPLAYTRAQSTFALPFSATRRRAYYICRPHPRVRFAPASHSTAQHSTVQYSSASLGVAVPHDRTVLSCCRLSSAPLRAHGMRWLGGRSVTCAHAPMRARCPLPTGPLPSMHHPRITGRRVRPSARVCWEFHSSLPFPATALSSPPTSAHKRTPSRKSHSDVFH